MRHKHDEVDFTKEVKLSIETGYQEPGDLTH